VNVEHWFRRLDRLHGAGERLARHVPVRDEKPPRRLIANAKMTPPHESMTSGIAAGLRASHLAHGLE